VLQRKGSSPLAQCHTFNNNEATRANLRSQIIPESLLAWLKESIETVQKRKK